MLATRFEKFNYSSENNDHGESFNESSSMSLKTGSNFNHINQLRKEIEELRKEKFQLKLKLERLSDFIWDCLEQLGKKLDKDLNNLKEEIKEEIMYSKD